MLCFTVDVIAEALPTRMAVMGFWLCWVKLGFNPQQQVHSGTVLE